MRSWRRSGWLLFNTNNFSLVHGILPMAAVSRQPSPGFPCLWAFTSSLPRKPSVGQLHCTDCFLQQISKLQADGGMCGQSTERVLEETPVICLCPCWLGLKQLFILCYTIELCHTKNTKIRPSLILYFILHYSKVVHELIFVILPSCQAFFEANLPIAKQRFWFITARNLILLTVEGRTIHFGTNSAYVQLSPYFSFKVQYIV